MHERDRCFRLFGEVNRRASGGLPVDSARSPGRGKPLVVVGGNEVGPCIYCSSPTDRGAITVAEIVRGGEARVFLRAKSVERVKPDPVTLRVSAAHERCEPCAVL